MLATLFVGMALGLGLFTFGYARGASYLTNDPQACANCHIMSDHFAAWTKSSHRTVATCNDCHTPHHPIRKYIVKARNGFWHSFYFTTGTFPDPLRITEGNRQVTEGACRYCHEPITDGIDHGHGAVPVVVPVGGAGSQESSAGEPISCIRCHKYAGHWVR